MKWLRYNISDGESNRFLIDNEMAFAIVSRGTSQPRSIIPRET